LAAPEEKMRFTRMMTYAGSRSGCRRRLLLRALAHEQPDCTGCDLCDGRAVAEPEGSSAILNIIKKAPRRYSKRELIALLAGRSTYETLRKGLTSRFGFGALRTWECDDIEEAVENLLLQKLIHAPQRGLFKYRYYCTGGFRKG
jgi:superfamily II DNA helicase RecQ